VTLVVIGDEISSVKALLSMTHKARGVGVGVGALSSE
jgi:hypothetical protein